MGSRNNLAAAYESAGDLGRAIPLYEATLADRERVLGPGHPSDPDKPRARDIDLNSRAHATITDRPTTALEHPPLGMTVCC
ncbi:tetratricopeptide repeat protein [Actinosynnema sp. NPDC047251]|uniref:tetratricopeptide repeat protein n=1 Tax=Saccharothrix espanaensis TaxID=103731 RepID=UPI0022B22D32|nr:tetratricopeptide repeat protein [Saccharothrix espanaensis]